MPAIEFKGKEFVFNHHLSVPYRPMPVDSKKSMGKQSADGNLVIHGDNLHALKALMPRYAGRVNVVYIDPPYNTGNESWRYNDNVNSPTMQEWLASNPVNKDDMLRHDKWLALMYPRLKLLRELMAEDGVILASIDDNEVHHMRVVMNEIFGEDNWVGTIVWKNVTDNNPTNIATEHEYIVCFAKNKAQLPKEWKSPVSEVKEKLIEVGKKLADKHAAQDDLQAAYDEWLSDQKPYIWPFQDYKFIDSHGIFTGSRSVHNPGKEGYRYPVYHPKTKKRCKEPMMGYRFPPQTMKELLDSGRIIFGDDETKIIEIKVYVEEFEVKLPSVITLDGRAGANELRALFPDKEKVFNNPKPRRLLVDLLSFVTKPDSVVLDSFAGTGTTAHAVLELNARDGGKRRFILIECEDYADSLTAERVRRVVKGVPESPMDIFHKGLGGSFAYCKLGAPLDLNDMLKGKNLPDYATLGEWLFHTATGESCDRKAIKEKQNYLGESQLCHVWLIYKSDLDFLQSPASALTRDLAEKIAKSKKGKKHLVFAAAKFVPNRDLASIGVDFAPLPFALYRVAKG